MRPALVRWRSWGVLLAGTFSFTGRAAEPPVPAAPQVESAPLSASPARRRLGLRQVLALAERQSPDLAGARAQAALVVESSRRAYGAWHPEITASAVYDHTSAPAQLDLGQFVGLVGGVYELPPVHPDLIPGPVTLVAADSYYGTVQITQPLLTPQGLFLPRAANSGAEAARLGAQEAREQILLGVARTHLGLVGIERLMNAAREAEAVALKREKDAQAQLEVGMAVEVGLLRAQAETAQARSQLAQLEGQREALLSLLEALVGEPVQPDADAPAEATLQPSAESAQPWEQTYLVRSARKQVEAAERLLTYDHFAWLPALAAIGKGNYNSNAGFTGKTLSYDLMLALSVPLYDRGARYAAKREDEIKLTQARAGLDASLAKARATWVAARANVKAAEAVLALSEAQAQLATRAQKQVEAAAQAGVTTSLELSDVDSKRFLAASGAAQARAALEIRRVEWVAAEGRLAQTLGSAEGAP